MSSKAKVLVSIESGIIVNRIVASDDFPAPEGFTLELDNPEYSIGGTLINSVYTPPVPEPEIVKTPEDFPLSRRQVRKAMVYAGIGLDDVTNTIKQIPDPVERDLALIDWEDAPVYQRSHPLFNTLAPAFGLTTEQLDTLWMWAADLDA